MQELAWLAEDLLHSQEGLLHGVGYLRDDTKIPSNECWRLKSRIPVSRSARQARMVNTMTAGILTTIVVLLFIQYVKAGLTIIVEHRPLSYVHYTTFRKMDPQMKIERTNHNVNGPVQSLPIFPFLQRYPSRPVLGTHPSSYTMGRG
jgi:hypothetical protein